MKTIREYIDLIESAQHTSTLWEQQEEELRKALLKNPQLFEDTQDYQRLQDFLILHSTDDPEIGQDYVYASVVSILPAHNLSIAHFGQPHRLVKLANGQAYFDVNGEVKAYPEGGRLSGDLLKKTFLFDSNDQFSQFLMLLKLQFGDWELKSRSIDGVAEDQATARMGLMSAMGSNDGSIDRQQMAAQAIERMAQDK